MHWYPTCIGWYTAAQALRKRRFAGAQFRRKIGGLLRARCLALAHSGDGLDVLAEQERGRTVGVTLLHVDVSAILVHAAANVVSPLWTEANVDDERKERAPALIERCAGLQDAHATLGRRRGNARKFSDLRLCQPLHEPILDPAASPVGERRFSGQRE